VKEQELARKRELSEQPEPLLLQGYRDMENNDKTEQVELRSDSFSTFGGKL
jgi:hypothetical protein